MTARLKLLCMLALGDSGWLWGTLGHSGWHRHVLLIYPSPLSNFVSFVDRFHLTNYRVVIIGIRNFGFVKFRSSNSKFVPPPLKLTVKSPLLISLFSCRVSVSKSISCLLLNSNVKF